MKRLAIMVFIPFIIASCESLETRPEEIIGLSHLSISGSSNSQRVTLIKSYQPSTINRNPVQQGRFGSSVFNVQFSTNTGGRGDPDTANWNVAVLDTAADVDYLTGLEKDIILEMNKVRTNPKKYAELYVQPRIRYFSGRNYSVPGQITIVTQEGAAAVNSCVSALNGAKSVDLLFPEKGLSFAAKSHVIDQSKTGQTGHNGSDRSTPETRMKKYGTFGGSWTWGENIAYGSSTGRDIIVDLLIDDGVPGRGHRANIMNSAFKQTGVGFGTHTQYRTSCTITYASGYTSN